MLCQLYFMQITVNISEKDEAADKKLENKTENKLPPPVTPNKP